MGILDSFKKSKDAAKPQPTPPQEGQTLAEILANKANAHMFGELLEKNGKNDLGGKIAKGTLDKYDMSLLEAQRKIFSEKMLKAESVEKLVTKDNLESIAASSDYFAQVINLVGTENAIKVIQTKLKEVSIKDPIKFQEMADAMEEQDSFKKANYKKENDKIEKFLKQHNVDPKEYMEAVAIKDPAEKERAMKALSRKQYGIFRRALNVFSSELGKDTLDDLKNAETSIEAQVKLLQDKERDIGYILFMAMDGNESMRKALAGELVGEKSPMAPKRTLKESKNAGELDVAKLKKDWEPYKKAKGFDKSGITTTEQDAIRDSFISEQEKAHEAEIAGGSFWDKFFDTMFKDKLKSKKSELN